MDGQAVGMLKDLLARHEAMAEQIRLQVFMALGFGRGRGIERKREIEEVTSPLPSTRPYTRLCWGDVVKKRGMESVLRSRGGLVGAPRGHGGAALPAGTAVTIILHYPYIFDSYEWSQCMQQAT